MEKLAMRWILNPTEPNAEAIRKHLYKHPFSIMLLPIGIQLQLAPVLHGDK